VLVALAVLVAGSSAGRSYYFSYNHHGEDWLEGECASRDRQSPIDLGREAPWDCNPPVISFLRRIYSPKLFRKMGFGKLAGDEDADESDDSSAGDVGSDSAIAAGPAPSMMLAPSPASSLLELNANASQVPAFPPPGPPMPTFIPTGPPPMFVAGCGTLGAFYFRYDKVERPMTIQNNGHTIATDLKGHGLGSITWDGYIFDVLSVNFHVKSEHTFNGEAMPLELHIVHREPETNHILVVAVPFQEVPSGSALLQQGRAGSRALRGKQLPLDPDADPNQDVQNVAEIADANDMSDRQARKIMPKKDRSIPKPKPSDPGFSEPLANLLSWPLPKEGESLPVPLRSGPVDLLTPLLGGATKMPEAFFQYRGSLTAPPCTEQVTWLVRKNPLYAARTQMEALRILIMQSNSNFENARSTMPLMGRHILYRLGINGDPPPPPPAPEVPAEGPPDRHVDFRGVSLAKDAMGRAQEAERAADVLTDAVAAAQRVRESASAAVDQNVASNVQSQIAAGDMIYTTPLPTPNPDRVLSRMVDAVAAQMDGAEKAAALASAGVR